MMVGAPWWLCSAAVVFWLLVTEPNQATCWKEVGELETLKEWFVEVKLLLPVEAWELDFGKQ